MLDEERIRSLSIHPQNPNPSLSQLRMTKGYSEPVMVSQNTHRMSLCLDSSSLNMPPFIREENSVESDDPDLSRLEDSDDYRNFPENYESSDRSFSEDENEESESDYSENQESENERINVLVNLGNRNHESVGIKFGDKRGLSGLDDTPEEEDKYSITVKAGNKVIEKTEDQVFQKNITIRRIKITGKVDDPDMSSSEEYPDRKFSFNTS